MMNMFKVINRSFPAKSLQRFLKSMIIAVCFLFAMQIMIEPAAVAGDGASTKGMKIVPAGKFKFGDEEEGTEEVIDLKAFYIDINEVTNAQYKKFKPDHKFDSGKADHPAANVSWHSADTYCKSLGKRLPNEEEWEKAARGSDARFYPWGEDFDEGFLNSSEGGKNNTSAVGSYTGGKSPYGINDMAGNVREWTADWHNIEKKIYKVMRGGGYQDGEEDVYTFSVKKSIPEDIKAYVGFRCAK